MSDDDGTDGEPVLDPDERREELLRAPKADEADAAPRIEVTRTESGATRIDIAETAVVRPGRGREDDRTDD